MGAIFIEIEGIYCILCMMGLCSFDWFTFGALAFLGYVFD